MDGVETVIHVVVNAPYGGNTRRRNPMIRIFFPSTEASFLVFFLIFPRFPSVLRGREILSNAALAARREFSRPRQRRRRRPGRSRTSPSDCTFRVASWDFSRSSFYVDAKRPNLSISSIVTVFLFPRVSLSTVDSFELSSRNFETDTVLYPHPVSLSKNYGFPATDAYVSSFTYLRAVS